MMVYKVGNSLFKMNIEKALSIARSGDTIQLAPGRYEINTVIQHALTFEAEQIESAVVLTGLISINNTSCIFKNIEFECSVSGRSLIVAKQSTLMFEYCYFYGTEVNMARAVQLSASSLTAYYCSFSKISSNAIKANNSSKIIIYNSIFKDLNDSSAIYLDSSQLSIKDTSFINIAANTINAIGHSHIKALDCAWQITQAPALYLNPSVIAEINNSVFKGNSTAIFGRKATLTLNACNFMNIDDGTVIDTIPPVIINHLFKGMNHSSVIEIEDSKLDMQGNQFINIAIHAIESIGRSHITAQDCLWHVNNMPAVVLQPHVNAEITNSVFKGSNATIVTQQATLVLNHCEFIDINAANPVKATQNSQITLNDCRLNGINKGTVGKLSAHSDKYLH